MSHLGLTKRRWENGNNFTYRFADPIVRRRGWLLWLKPLWRDRAWRRSCFSANHYRRVGGSPTLTAPNLSAVKERDTQEGGR